MRHPQEWQMPQYLPATRLIHAATGAWSRLKISYERGRTSY